MRPRFPLFSHFELSEVVLSSYPLGTYLTSPSTWVQAPWGQGPVQATGEESSICVCWMKAWSPTPGVWRASFAHLPSGQCKLLLLRTTARICQKSRRRGHLPRWKHSQFASFLVFRAMTFVNRQDGEGVLSKGFGVRLPGLDQSSAICYLGPSGKLFNIQITQLPHLQNWNDNNPTENLCENLKHKHVNNLQQCLALSKWSINITHYYQWLSWWFIHSVSFPGAFKSSHILSASFLAGSVVKNLPIMQEAQVRSLGQEDLLEKGMATHSSILAWKWKCWLLSHAWLFVTPWTATCQAPLSMEFSWQEYWNSCLENSKESDRIEQLTLSFSLLIQHRAGKRGQREQSAHCPSWELLLVFH